MVERYERFDYGDTDFYCYLFDQAVYYFGISIQNTLEGKKNLNKKGEYIRKLSDLLKENESRKNPSLTDLSNHFTETGITGGIKISYQG